MESTKSAEMDRNGEAHNLFVIVDIDGHGLRSQSISNPNSSTATLSLLSYPLPSSYLCAHSSHIFDFDDSTFLPFFFFFLNFTGIFYY